MKKLSALLLALLLTVSCCFGAAAAETEATPSEAVSAEPDMTTEPEDVPDDTSVPPAAPLYGDVNGDGVVDITDATDAQKYVAEMFTREQICFDLADVDFDGEVTILDVTIIQKYLAQFIEHFDVPKALTVQPASLRLGVGESVALTSSYTEEDGAVGFESDDPAVASVDENGVVTAVGVGTATVTASAAKKQSAVCTVTVGRAVSAVSLNETSLALFVGDGFDLTATIDAEEVTYCGMFRSDNPSVVSVDPESGALRAEAAGEANVTYETYNGISASCFVTVRKAVTSVSLNRAALTMGTGETFQLVATIPADEYSTGGSFFSDDPAIASVDPESGRVIAHTAGNTAITYQTDNGVTATCSVTVLNTKPNTVAFEQPMVALSVGDTAPLTVLYDGTRPACQATFTSDKPAVAAVDAETGKLTAKAVGTATVTVRSINGKTAKCYVTVKKAPSGISFSAPEMKLLVGEAVQLYVYPAGRDEVCSGVSFSSSDIKTGTVTASGKLTAKRAGAVTVTATAPNGKSATLTVTIVESAGSLVKTTTKATSMREDAAWASPEVCNVPAGVTVTVFGYSSDSRWLRVKYGDRCGWIYNKAVGVAKNYTSVTLATLPVVADDIIFNCGADLRTVYDYVQNNIKYRSSVEGKSVEEMAVSALSKLYGACYQRASTLNVLMARMGYDVIYVIGHDELTGNNHRWDLVKTADGWRHIDPTQVRLTYITLPKYYLVKDSDLKYFTWDRTKYPAAV